MPLDNSKLKKVYATLQQGGYKQDYKTFLKGFTGNDHYENRKKVYDLLSANGARIGSSYEEFMKKMQVAPAPAKSTPAKPKGTPITEAYRQKVLANVGNMMAETNASIQRTQNRMDYARANAGLRVPRVTIGDKNSGVRLGQNTKVVAKKPQYNPKSGKMEQTYITESGNEFTDRGAADLEQNTIDAYKDSMSVSGQLRDAYAERDRLDEAMKKRMKEIDEHPNQRFNDFMRESAAAMTPGAGPAGELEARMSKYDNDDEYLQLMAAARKNHQTIQLLEDKKNNQMNSFWHSLGTTALNGYTFTDGMSEMRDATALTRASKHIDSINRKRAAGKPLTREEQTAEAVLKNFATDNAVQGMYGGDYGAWARAGGMTANSLDFMKDLMLNPGAGSMAKGIMRGTAKGMAKGLAKVTGKEAAQLWKNDVVRRTLKATGVLIGAHMAGAYVSNTTGIGRTAATMGTLASGKVGVDDNGNYTVENAMGLLPAFAEAERQQARENGSEMFGEFIPGVGGMVKKGLEKIGLSKLSGAMTNIGNKEWYKQYSRLLESGGYNGLPGEALEEYEGSLFDALTGHAGDAWDDMTNLQNHVDIWLGCATMGALLGSVPMMMQGHHTAQYYRYKHNTDKADNLASFRMTAERWVPLRDKIDNTDNSKMADVVTGIINNPDLHPEEKKAALNYVRNLTMMRGYNIAQVNNASDDEEQRPEVQSVNDNYSKGYDTTEPQAMNDAKNLLDMKREQVAKEHGIENVDEVDALIGDDPLRYIEEQKQLGNTDKLQSVIDYANAKSAYDGMVQRVQDDIDSRIEETNATVDSRVNRHDGMIHPASLKLQNEDGTDKKVYIVSGNVVMFDDGKGVDREKSDNTIVIRDVETGEMKVIPPDLIRGLDAAVDPEEEKARAREAIIEEMSQTAANNVDGVVSFNEGDTYTLTDENGEQTQVTLVANEQGLVDNGDGTVNVTVDGQNVVPMSMEDIQGGVDATNMARTVQAEQERQANGENVPNSDESVQNDGENVQETPDGVEYGVNDTFTFIDGEGATIHGEVQGISDDGVEIRTDEPLNGKRVQVIPAEEFENNVESINDADGNQVWAREYAEDAAATEEVSDSTEPLDHDLVAPATPTTEELVQMARGGNELAQHQLEAQGVEWEEPAKMQQTALSRVPINEETQEPMFEKADRETALDALNEVTGGNDENTTAIVRAQVEQATKALEALKKKEPTKKAPSLKGSPMAMVKAQQEAEANYNTAMEEYNAQVAAAEENLNAWSRINSLMNDRKRAIREQQEAERKVREEKLHAEAVARLEEDKRIAAEKAAEQEAVGTHAVNPKIKAKWDGATKVEGNPNAITLADGSTIRGHYVLTEAGASTASHDVNNAYEPTEGFPVDENGESVNDRDYKRDKDAQRIVRDMADSYDSRALQTPVIVSKDGVVLSGNNRTMSGEIAAKNGTDKAYVDHLREFGAMFGFTPEQIDGMQHPRVVFVPDEELPYDASTFARFNAEQQKKQSKPEHAVKLGKIVPDNVFTSITNDISRFDRMSDYYADDKSVASAISQLLDAGVINEMQLPELRTGNALSAAGKELIENTLIGKVFQTSPDAVRQIISTPTLRQSVVMGLNEIANNRTLAKSGYDLSKELAAAVDLVSRAKSDSPEIYKEGMPVSPYGRQQGLFDDEYGDSRVTDGVTLLLADLLNSGKPSDLRKVLSTYNNEAASSAAGQIDMFSGDVTSKEEILKNVNEYFRNATPKEQQALIDAAVAERKRRAEAAEPAGGNEASEQATVVAGSDAEPQQPVVASEKPVKGNEPDADALAKEAEDKLSERITDTEDEWTEPSEYGEIYKHRMFVDGKEVIKVDAPDKSKNYPGTYYEIDGKQFGDLYEVANYIDGNEQPLSAKIEAASAEVNTDPTEAQKEAGNYKKGHVQVGTFDITIEQPQGSVRKGTDADGKQWESKMNNTYGYIRGAVGVDGDHIDVFLSNDIDGWNGRKVYVVDQYNPNGSFDEHKVMLGFNDADEAKGDYLANYEQGWENGRRIDITGVNLEDFEKWIESSKRKTKPFGEYSSVKKDVVEINTPEEAGYSITPSTYTNKKGKTSDVSLLTFGHDLTADQERAVKEFAKERTGEGRFAPARGWKDRESGGWMFRSEEDARKAAEMVGNEEAVADNQQNWESRDIIPGREGHTPFVSNEDIARINAKMAGKWVGEPKEAMESAMSERVTELSERLHTPVRIIRTEEEVAALPSVRQRRMKGSFNPMTGEVTIVVPNNANMADVENTFVHEVVGHDGLRVLFSDEAKLNNALDELYRVSKDEIRGTIDRMAQKMYDAEVDRIREKKRKEHVANGEDANASYYADMAAAHAEAGKKREQFKRDATEEYGADLAGRIGEKGFEKMSAEELTFWGKLKAMLQKALQKLLDGLKIPGKRKWGDKDWAFVLHEAYKRKKNGGKPTVFDAADTEVMRRKTGFGDTKFSDGKREQQTANERFNNELTRYQNGEMDKNEMLHLGRPQGVMRTFLPNLPIVMRQRVIKKGSEKKHEVDVSAIMNMPQHLSSPIFVFQRSEDTIGVLTDMRDRNGKNVCVAIELKRQIQQGAEYLEVNDVRSFHGREFKNIVEPIANNKTLKWVDKEKGLAYLSSASQPVQQEIDKQVLDTATKVVKDFVNPKVSDENVADGGIMFRDGDSVEYNKAMARDIYEQRVSRGMYQMQEALQDSMLGLKEAMDAILKAEGNGKTYIEDVAGYENAYLGENRLSSVNQAECTAFAQTLFKPMLEEVAKLAKTADERAELTDYMMAKHGLERNEVMARRAAEKDARLEFFAEVLAAQQAVDNDPLDQDAIDAFEDVKQRMQDREEELYLINRERDYAGLTALTGMDNVLDAETEAQQMVSDYERGHWVDGLWDKVNAVTKATLQKTYESGLINKATYDDISGMYENYIPLRGFDDKTSDEAYAYLTDKHSAFNAPIKTAKGRKSKADDPFANMEAMAESAIMQGNRNTLVKQKFLNFALNHPSDLVSVSDLWLWHNDVADEWQPINSGDLQGTERIEEDDSPAEVERKMRDFEYAMQQAAKNDPAHFRKQKDNPAIPYRVVESRDLRQHQVLVKRNGRDIILTINGNPRAAQALNGQTNPDNDVSGAIGAIMRLGETVNRQLSAFYTTRNPDFVVSNFMRDMMYANTMVLVKESPNYAWRFHKNVAKVNPAKMKVLLAKLRNGTLDLNDETEKMFHLFMMNGGETGYANIRDIEQRKNDIKRELKKSNGQMPIRKAWDLLGERLDEYNRAVENCARFAAFMTSRQLGRTIDRSVYDAKEISVNFNKKGSGAKFWKTNGQTGIGNVAAFTSGLGRSFYVFWNAALQGSTNFGRQFKRHPKKAIAGAAAMFLLGALMASIGGGDGDDDKDDKNDYFNLPEYVRRSNVVFRLPGMDKSWISMPLPVEYRAMYGMGELMVSAISGKEHYTAGELAHQMASQVSQMLPIDIMEGSGGFKAFVPSAIKPIAEVIGNESWTGMPIYKDTPFNKDMPEWTKAYKSANKYLVGLSKALNEATGGDAYTSGKIDINPAQVEYLLNGIFGGVSSTIDRLTKMGETVIGDREYDPRSFLLLNRLVKNGDERTEYRAVNNEYFRIKEESEKLRTRLNHYENDTADGVFDYAEKIAWLNNSPEYRILETYEDYSGDIDDINEELKAAASDEERKGLEAELNEKKKELVDAVNNIRNGKQQ